MLTRLREVGLLVTRKVMAQDFSRQFYNSSAWQKCRKAYLTSVHYLCEDCLAAGRYTPAEIVHHKIELTPDNVTNPSITMDFSNLKAVCRECHLQEHGINKKRYMVRPDGRVEIKNFFEKTEKDSPP